MTPDMSSGEITLADPADSTPAAAGGESQISSFNVPLQPLLPPSSTSSSMMGPPSHCIALRDVQEAADRIRGLAHVTPVLTCRSLNDMARRRLYFKVEALQKTGSFKYRGAVNAIKHAFDQGQADRKSQSSEEANASPSEAPACLVVTHSSGNHAQAVALAARTVNPSISATIVMPRNTPLVKKSAVQDFGGTVVLVDNTNVAREREADRIASAARSDGRQCWFVHPSEDPKVIAGQGTVGWELVQQLRSQFHLERPDVAIIPVGGGGLAAGNIVALRGLLGDVVQIVLAEPQALDDAHRSFYAKRLLSHDPSNLLDSVADGLKTTLGPNTWPIVRDGANDIFTVSEVDILRATKAVWERLKVCIEPSAGVGVAVALYSDAFRAKYPPAEYPDVAIVLCGGNVDILRIPAKMAKLGL